MPLLPVPLRPPPSSLVPGSLLSLPLLPLLPPLRLALLAAPSPLAPSPLLPPLSVLLFLLSPCFSAYIVFDTQMIVGGTHKYQFSVDDYAMAAIMLYIDIIQLFVHLLRIFGNRR
ncbi:unnamed protein product [Prorocentrum cordatum]|uniref:Uncharacterized protein n=1 Tax=Prorocentrum cordatum TaxID=2364126 RepID=A0ABN9Q2T4_9DINO|nr:unnamed protein product [Polarella glacialis]